MKKTLIYYGSSTGTTQDIAFRIAKQLGLESTSVKSAADISTDDVAAAEALLLGTSTWGDGELQDDWYDGVKVLEQSDLSGKVIALFGCGDSESYPDTFCGAVGVLYHALGAAYPQVVGRVSTDGYNFSGSEALVDGKFVGLLIDELNESDKTDERINAWVAEIAPSLA